MKKKNIKKKDLRDFGLLIGIGFPILIGWLIPAISGEGFREWSLWIGIPGLIIGLFKPNLLLYPYNIWMAIGNALGRLNSNLIFGLIFIIILLPIALIMRLTGYDPLQRKKQVRDSYRENRKAKITDLTRIF